MTLIKRNTSKHAKAKKVVAKKGKAAKRSARRWGISKAIHKVVPKRVAVLAGGAVAAVAGALAVKKRKASSETPAYTPPTPAPAPPAPPKPSAAPPVPPAPPTAPPETSP
jgi:hypothetical protein